MEKITVLGLGYVGLPLAVELANAGYYVYGLDINADRIAELKRGEDSTLEVDPSHLKKADINYTTNIADCADSTIFIITVPTPIDAFKRPDLTPLDKATHAVAPFLKKGDVVVYESTVYPGVTEDYCMPILEKHTGLKGGVDFSVGYSPERISPGDKVNTLRTIKKIVSANTPEGLERLNAMYSTVVDAGLHLAPSIKVAEAAKVIENTQRDVNIALMNECSLIFDKMGISTRDVLDAAGTKWNFLKFSPGLVGGHCIGVDPYYIAEVASRYGITPRMISTARQTNNSMASFVVNNIMGHLVSASETGKAKVGILGVTFKEDVPDIRNSLIFEVIDGLKEFNIPMVIADAHADSDEVRDEYGHTLNTLDDFSNLDVLVLGANHAEYLTPDFCEKIKGMLKTDGLLFDLKSAYNDTLRHELGDNYKAL